MGMLDRFAGSPRDRFARRVLATVRSAGLVESVVHSPGPPQTWQEARADLRPVLRSGTFALNVPEPAKAPLRRPALPYLDELVVLDRPTSMAYVSHDMAATWGVPATEVFATARNNLAAGASLPEPSGEQNAVLRFVDDGSGYFVSRLLLDGWLGALATHVRGRPVAFVPDHNTLMVASVEPGLLGELFRLAEKEYEEAARQLSPQAYTLDPYGRVEPYQAPEGHPLAAAVGRADALLACAEYAAQGEWLTELYERTGRDVFVATLSRAGRPDGTAFTFATWGEDVDTLLPRADHVAFASDRFPPFFVSWDVLTREVDLTPVEGLRPERYRLTGWPPEPVVERLRSRAAMP